MMLCKLLSLFAIAGLSLAAPGCSPSSSSSSVTSSSASSTTTSRSSGNSTSSGNGDVTVTIKNSCSSKLHVYKLANGGDTDQETTDIVAGSSHDFKVDSQWAGRFWACKDGQRDCAKSGCVSLAEFLFNGFGGSDFYDISFVDGFNLPLDISPHGGSGKCGSPSCSKLPSCPKELQTKSGECRSACAAFGTPEYCCTGAYNSPAKCKASKFADGFKKACKDAYSYAYDDATSTFGCRTNKYTVTFCP